MKVFLSSTAQDLNAHREVVEDVILDLSQQIVAMEHFRALPGTPVEECERLARESDVVVCIVAHRYGSGITRNEVEAAHKAGKDVLVWIVADDHPWSEKKEENLLADPNVFGDPAKTEEVRERVEALFNFKAWLRKTFTADTFTTPDDLGKKIAIALTNYVKGHAAPRVTQDRISIARLPVTGSELFGREAELLILDDAWANANTNIVSFVAWGGVGKTALVNHWLKRRMARDNYRGAERVLGWSFFSQGSSERAASADLFIDWALRWFGDVDATAGTPWDKGERLARFIRQSRTLLILDGLEPLQHPPGSQEGCLKDAALQALLIQLAAQQHGLCVVSTRERLSDLAEFENSTVIRHDLEHLSPQAGAQILRSLNVRGQDDELEEATKELGGHAFSITLLGSYLDEALNGDVRRRNEIEDLFGDTRYGSGAQRMITAYEKWLGEGIELAILRLLGLFDRPADLSSLSALREEPIIAGLTEPLQHLRPHEFNRAVAKLRRIKLLGEASSDEYAAIDAHPLVREHFKQQIKRERPDAWREANRRLYEHIKQKTKDLPDTVEEMSPLYAAIAHGCAAGKHQDACDEVYVKRIQRGPEFFNLKKLGAFAADLATVSNFFEQLWDKPVPNLTSYCKALVLNAAGSSLRALGRSDAAMGPLSASLKTCEAIEDWFSSAIGAGNLSEFYLILGNIPQALEFAGKSVEHADRSGDMAQRFSKRTTLAEALYCAGQVEDAIAKFREAETMLQEWKKLKFLFSLWGFRYCDLLLEQGHFEDVKERIAWCGQLPLHKKQLLDIALENLSLGRALAIEAQLLGEGDYSQAERLLQHAVQGLQRAGTMNHVPKAMLARASVHRLDGKYIAAEHDLGETFRIVNRAGWNLYLPDYHLESSRLQLARRNPDKAREHLATAKQMINHIGYHRRDKEIAELEAQLA